MLNFRTLKKDFPPAILKEGKELYTKAMVVSVKIITISADAVQLECQVRGNFENNYECELEIDRNESCIIDSDCDCPYKYDCSHLAAVLFYLESHFDEIVVAYSNEADLDSTDTIDDEEKEELRVAFKEAQTKESKRKDKREQEELLQEYMQCAETLVTSPFFLPEVPWQEDRAELAVILSKDKEEPQPPEGYLKFQLALRLPYRSKPLHIPNVREFFDALRHKEPLKIGSKRFSFSLESFKEECASIIKMLLPSTRFFDPKSGEKVERSAILSVEDLGMIIAKAYETAKDSSIGISHRSHDSEELSLPYMYVGGLEEPMHYTKSPVQIHFDLEYFKAPAPKILINPSLQTDSENQIKLSETQLLPCSNPGMLHNNCYYRFPEEIQRKHLRYLPKIGDVIIPEPLFGTFVENTLPELMRFAHVTNRQALENFVTLPYVDKVQAICDINFLKGELDASLYFVYDKKKVPASHSKVDAKMMKAFLKKEGILARNLIEEKSIIEDLFTDFFYDEKQGTFVAKSDKKIVEFMTEIVPKNQHRVEFNCPENLLGCFLYDDTTFEIHCKESKNIDTFDVELKVNGMLKGTTVDLLWDCLSSKRSYIELEKKSKSSKKGEGKGGTKLQKILVIDLEKLAPVVQIFDEIGLNKLTNHTDERPLWTLAGIDQKQFEGLPIKFSISKRLLEIQKQMVGTKALKAQPIPKEIKATLRSYQADGVNWLNRLRTMHLNGILADDMGLGKTLQAIAGITQAKKKDPNSIHMVVCPTSLVYNWEEEFNKFNSKLKVQPVDGTPAQRKKLLQNTKGIDVLITSYSLMQKDIEIYKKISFGYAILDEAQHIKNRGTRNAKSVKMIRASHRLILTGTPIENSLDELWSLFDFLMPGLLSSYDRFVEKYIRSQTPETKAECLDNLRRKISPFILRRMKKDLLSELPPVSQIVYHCHLSDSQKELYRSYANSAREELSKLVKKEGFDKVQIHVLATLTRLKQICCHPAIFAKETPEVGDSAKYDMLLELLETLIEGGHKTVVFSQYTRMLKIMKQEFEQKGIKFSYLDGSSKNRMDIVNEFNNNKDIPVFLVSLKAGGSGLNLTGADTVIHYDMWWNPAVENQATDRVHRIGQTASVSSYKLVTLNTIEEKIQELQNRKRGLVQKVIASDDEVISKLTWEEVLELLQT